MRPTAVIATIIERGVQLSASLFAVFAGRPWFVGTTFTLGPSDKHAYDIHMFDGGASHNGSEKAVHKANDDPL